MLEGYSSTVSLSVYSGMPKFQILSKYSDICALWMSFGQIYNKLDNTQIFNIN